MIILFFGSFSGKQQTLKGRAGSADIKKLKAPGLSRNGSGLVDEVEVYRKFGGCLPAERAQPQEFLS
ncbi:hypothetical protein [Bacillus sp. MUM 13]|uniref:hypothetical protein n=1 Tax=Bacillus sp. MUM 13 TaxID=1678001 RepID=UPI0008F58C3E|nr:hypothetical protein [Bacillus sp. MUM 13]OIK10210.1 hypothetical protein BIV59_14775 [Bacillus sp. MUM 13]